jgi:Fe-S cluster assembly protein SufD
MFEILQKQFQTLPQDGLNRVRQKGWDHFQKIPLPKKWNHLPVLQASNFTPSSLSFKSPYRLVFVNGFFKKELSCFPNDPKVIIQDLKQGMGSFGAYLNNHFSETTKWEKNSFAHLNLALFQEGALIYLSPNTVLDHPLEIVYVVEGSGVMVTPRVHLFAGKGAEISILETYIENGVETFFNPLSEFVLDVNAKVHVTSDKSQSSENFYRFSTTRATLKKASSFTHVLVTSGSLFGLEDIQVTLNGEGAEANLMGAWKLEKKGEAHINVQVRHAAPNCRSRQLYKGALFDRSRSSFEGKIFVESQAQKTDAFQLNNNLLLSEHAHADARPNLEIFADDVKASHGATVGQLDEEVLFYLKTRGMGEAEAQALFIHGFLQEVLSEMRIPCVL